MATLTKKQKQSKVYKLVWLTDTVSGNRYRVTASSFGSYKMQLSLWDNNDGRYVGIGWVNSLDDMLATHYASQPENSTLVADYNRMLTDGHVTIREDKYAQGWAKVRRWFAK